MFRFEAVQANYYILTTQFTNMNIRTAIFEVYTDKIGEFRFRFLCDSGESRLRASEGYNAKVNAIKGIDSVMRNIDDDKRIEFKVNSRGKHFFTVKARNGNILAVSRNQEELDTLEEDLVIIRQQFAKAEVSETTNPS